MNTRFLGAQDAAAYRKVRRRALQEHPEAFGMSPDELDAMNDETVAQRLTGLLPESGTIGAFVDGELVGIVYVSRHHRLKIRHRAQIDAMYVVPEMRRQKMGKALLEAGLEHLRNLDNVRHVILSVTSGNTPARGLYRSLGFVTWGVEPVVIRVGDVFHDVEWMVLPLQP